jgi:uncharacterized membrane protein YdjX (TVP38/TMEM64 family)
MAERPWLRGVVILAAIGAAGAALYFSPLGKHFDANELVDFVRRSGSTWWAVPLFFLLYALLDVFFIPTQFLSIAAVLMWGWWKGATIELLAATAGAFFPYFIARSTLREWIAGRVQSHGGIAARLDRDPFTLLLILRVVPVIPYTPLNYVAGLSSIRTRDYLLATLIGMVPSTYIFAYFVEATAEGLMEPRDVMWRMLIAALLLAALILTTRLAAAHVRRRLSRDRTASPTDAADRG